MTRAANTMIGNSHQAPQGKTSDLAASRLKYGSSSQASTIARIKEQRLKSRDSVRNCLTRLPRPEPITFRSPTSLARLADLAVQRLIKLMQAISRMKQATAPHNQTTRNSPSDKP